jgi:hypothetical protein
MKFFILSVVVLGALSVSVQAQLTISRYTDEQCSRLAPSPDALQGVVNPLVMPINACVMIFDKISPGGMAVKNFNKVVSCAANNNRGSFASVALYGDSADVNCNGATAGPQPFPLGVCQAKWYGPSDTLFTTFTCTLPVTASPASTLSLAFLYASAFAFACCF